MNLSVLEYMVRLLRDKKNGLTSSFVTPGSKKQMYPIIGQMVKLLLGYKDMQKKRKLVRKYLDLLFGEIAYPQP